MCNDTIINVTYELIQKNLLKNELVFSTVVDNYESLSKFRFILT